MVQNEQTAASMKTPEKEFLLESEGREIEFTLESSGNGESIIAKPGILQFDSSGVKTLYFRQGREFEFKTTLEEFHAQDKTYRTMGIDLLQLRIIPRENKPN